MNLENRWYEEYETDPDYQFELLAIAVGEEIVEAMERLGLTRSQLARRMGVSKPRISQILAGDENLTLRTLVGVAVALQARLKIALDPIQPEGISFASEGWPGIETSTRANGGNRQLALAA